jgi:cytochrome c1
LHRGAIPHGNRRRFAPVPDRMGGVKHTETIALLAFLGALAACKQPPETRQVPDAAAMERGLAAIERAGCAACHEIPGLDWPRGRTGPSLAGFDDVGPIAGALPNTPDNLAAFVRNAPAAKPGSTMPAMPLSEDEARDVAAYLYGMSDA